MKGKFARSEVPTIWALKDVSFEQRQGEVLGIVGRNGAGKSTLLKILSRITRPTLGRAEIHGRVGSLLEVGTGFHPELTGRENILLNGVILGMKRREIRRRFDEIVAFAEVEQFLDTPVKRYSSGMYMRLAFAVAAHLDPEILIVDEVLAVGDAQFQKKCLGKIGEVSHRGRTVLFVSHNMVAIESLCRNAIWLDGGRIVRSGPTEGVVREYLQTALVPVLDREWERFEEAPGDEMIRLHRVAVRPDHAAANATLLNIRTPIALEFHYWNRKPGLHMTLSILLYNEDGVLVFNSDTCVPSLGTGLFRTTCRIPGDLLNSGTYTISVLFARDEAYPLFDVQDALVFDVADSVHDRGSWYGKWPGAIRPALRWETAPVGEMMEMVATR